MKSALFVAVLLATLSPLVPHTAHATSATIDLAPGVSLQLGERDRRGYYWDGGNWREPRWWNDRYQYNEHRWWRHEEWKRHKAWERDAGMSGNAGANRIAIMNGNVARTGDTMAPHIIMTTITEPLPGAIAPVFPLPAERLTHQ